MGQGWGSSVKRGEKHREKEREKEKETKIVIASNLAPRDPYLVTGARNMSLKETILAPKIILLQLD